MESLAFLHCYVGYEDHSADWIGRSPDLSTPIQRATWIGMAGAIVTTLTPYDIPVAQAVLQPGEWCPEVSFAQRALARNGYFVGEIDGNFGSTTLSALRRFQRVNRLPVTGVIDAATAQALGLAPAIACVNGASPASSLNALSRDSATSSSGPGNLEVGDASVRVISSSEAGNLEVRDDSVRVIVLWLNVREGPGLEHRAIAGGELAYGTVVTPSQQHHGWYKIANGWIASNGTAPSNFVDPIPPPSIPPERLTPYSVRVSVPLLNVRVGPGVEYDLLAGEELSCGAELVVTEIYYGWYKTTTGWIAGNGTVPFQAYTGCDYPV